MARYHVAIGYRTKRQAVEMGMDVEAFGPDEAEEIAMSEIINPYPARKWAYTKVSEAIAR